MMIIVYILKYTVSIIIIPQSVLFHPFKNFKKCLFYFYSNYPKISQFYSTIIPLPPKFANLLNLRGIMMCFTILMILLFSTFRLKRLGNDINDEIVFKKRIHIIFIINIPFREIRY